MNNNELTQEEERKKEKNKTKRMMQLATGIIVFSAFIIIFLICFRQIRTEKLTLEEKYYENGKYTVEASNDNSNIAKLFGVKGSPDDLSFALSQNGYKADISKIDPSKPGVYKITVKKGKKTEVVEICIKDTQKPHGSLVSDHLYLAKGSSLNMLDVVKNIDDNSGIVYIEVHGRGRNGMIQNKILKYGDMTLRYDKNGTFHETVVLRDKSKNKEMYSFDVTVEDGPKISGVKDLTITVGSSLPAWLKGVSAYDQKDKNITNKIKVDYSTVNTKKAGIYTIVYSVKNSNGITATKRCNLTIKNKSNYESDHDKYKNKDSDKKDEKVSSKEKDAGENPYARNGMTDNAYQNLTSVGIDVNVLRHYFTMSDINTIGRNPFSTYYSETTNQTYVFDTFKEKSE